MGKGDKKTTKGKRFMGSHGIKNAVKLSATQKHNKSLKDEA